MTNGELYYNREAEKGCWRKKNGSFRINMVYLEI